jgi:L-lysine 2,3-aminomutase
MTALLPWQQALRDSFRSLPELLSFLSLDPETYSGQEKSAFPLRVPKSFAQRMQKGNPHCPLLKQVLNPTTEKTFRPGFNSDPLEEKKVNPLPGVLHKFSTKILITLTGSCAVHCRYCFRQHFPYHDNTPGLHDFDRIIDYIRAHPMIEEVIFSGGDPLSLPDRALEKRIEVLSTVPQLKYLRLHTRFPIVIPSRLTQTLGEILSQGPLKTTMVVHMNHPQEMNAELRDAFQAFRPFAIPLFNQSVLLKGINDDALILKALIERGFRECAILPYYVHLLDKVQGSEHFEVSQKEAIALYHALCATLPGFLVPRFVREEPGAPAKISVLE